MLLFLYQEVISIQMVQMVQVFILLIIFLLAVDTHYQLMPRDIKPNKLLELLYMQILHLL
jgi:hypothetical protein